MTKESAQALISDLDILIEKTQNGAVNYADIIEALQDLHTKLSSIEATLPEAAAPAE